MKFAFIKVSHKPLMEPLAEALGTTPPPRLIQHVSKALNIPLKTVILLCW